MTAMAETVMEQKSARPGAESPPYESAANYGLTAPIGISIRAARVARIREVEATAAKEKARLTNARREVLDIVSQVEARVAQLDEREKELAVWEAELEVLTRNLERKTARWSYGHKQ